MMHFDEISDYDYVCCECGHFVEAAEFFCGHPAGLPDECPECACTEYIPHREALENKRINAEGDYREDLRLFQS